MGFNGAKSFYFHKVNIFFLKRASITAGSHLHLNKWADFWMESPTNWKIFTILAVVL